jgi:hypothetical protein
MTDSQSFRQPPVWDVTVEFEMTDGSLTLTQIAADAAGRESAVKMAIQIDGQDHPIKFGNDLVLRAKWTELGALETIVKQGERIVGKGMYEVSADGQSLIVSTAEHTVVFARV